MTRLNRFFATPLMSAAIFGATFGMSGTAAASSINECSMAPDAHARTFDMAERRLNF